MRPHLPPAPDGSTVLAASGGAHCLLTQAHAALTSCVLHRPGAPQATGTMGGLMESPALQRIQICLADI